MFIVNNLHSPLNMIDPLNITTWPCFRMVYHLANSKRIVATIMQKMGILCSLYIITWMCSRVASLCPHSAWAFYAQSVQSYVKEIQRKKRTPSTFHLASSLKTFEAPGFRTSCFSIRFSSLVLFTNNFFPANWTLVIRDTSTEWLDITANPTRGIYANNGQLSTDGELIWGLVPQLEQDYGIIWTRKWYKPITAWQNKAINPLPTQTSLHISTCYL